MRQREQRHHGASSPSRSAARRRLGVVPDVLVVLAVVFAFVAYDLDLGARWGLARDEAGHTVSAPGAGLSLPGAPAAVPVALPAATGSATTERVRRAIAGALGDPKLGGHVGVVVRNLGSREDVFRSGPATVTPASTMKLLTSAAALQSLGPATRFETTVRRVPGTQQIVLVGGGDPMLAGKPERDTYPQVADIRTLARRTASALIAQGVRTVRLSYDDSLFTGPAFNPTWPATYVADVVPPITALWVDQGHNPSGHGFVADPALQATKLFRAALARNGVRVTGPLGHRAAPASAQPVASVTSPPLGQIVSHLLLVSDNNAAEVVAHHLGRRAGGEASFAGGARGVRSVLSGLGVRLGADRIYDGSGLSRRNRLSLDTLADVLQAAASPEHPTLRQVITGLPMAGFSGSLTYRFDTGPAFARGRVQAKTGTLTGVHGLAGVATDRSGDELLFVMIADRVRPANEYYTQNRLDQIAGALADCACGTPQSAGAG